MYEGIWYTKDNGEIVDADYARRRIISCRSLHAIGAPLAVRQQVAERIVTDRGYRGLLVSYLCRDLAMETYVNMVVEQQEVA